jgi:hypothetical protein
MLASISFTAFASYKANHFITKPPSDSVKLKIDGEHAYYQKVVKVDSTLRESHIYIRTLQFMASKNFQQTYGYQEEGKLIFTTTQDLNVNLVYVGDDSDDNQPYTVQFAITVDIKNGSYRYTINNVVFFLPVDNGNKRETLYDAYVKANTRESRRIAREAKKLIVSFERYITALTDDLYEGIEQKSLIYKSKF